MNEMDKEDPLEQPLTLEEENRSLKAMLSKALVELRTMTDKNMVLLEDQLAEGHKIDEALTMYRSTLEETEMRIQMLVQQRDDAITEVVRLRGLLREMEEVEDPRVDDGLA